MRLLSLIFGRKSHSKAFDHTEAIYNKARRLYQHASHLHDLGRTLDHLRAEMQSEDKVRRAGAQQKYKDAVKKFHEFNRSYLKSLAAIRAHLNEINKIVRH